MRSSLFLTSPIPSCSLRPFRRPHREGAEHPYIVASSPLSPFSPTRPTVPTLVKYRPAFSGRRRHLTNYPGLASFPISPPIRAFFQLCVPFVAELLFPPITRKTNHVRVDDFPPNLIEKESLLLISLSLIAAMRAPLDLDPLLSFRLPFHQLIL